MATSIFNSVATNATDADFRDWGSKISSSLAAVGFVKTADTGQINWSTVLKPASSNTSQGYEIWRFNDSLQATYPLFVRLEYGSASSATVPGMNFIVGKGSNGSGTITGVLKPSTQTHCQQVIATTGNSYVSSGDGSVFAISPFGHQMSIGNTFFILIERSRSAAGIPNGDGICVINRTQSSNYFAQTSYQYSSGTDYSPSPTVPLVILPTPGSMANGSTAPVFMVVCYTPNYVWQLRGALSGRSTDVGGIGTTVTVPNLGTYMVTGPSYFDALNTSTATLLMMWS